MPPSKSYTHRALASALLSDRPTRLKHPLLSEDTEASLRAARGLGAEVRREETTGGEHVWSVEPPEALAGHPSQIDVGESGTTLRIFTSLSSLGTARVTFVGKPGLARRPITDLLRALGTLGARIDAPPTGTSLPFGVRGPIHGGAVRVDVSQTSQYLSGLLLSLPAAEGESVIRPEGAPVSVPYVEATLAFVRSRGIRIEEREGAIHVPGGQVYSADPFEIPGDASSAAYLAALAAITGGKVTLQGLPATWPQADLVLLDILREAGAEVHRTEEDSVEVRGPGPRGLTAFRADLDANPDLAPLLSVLAAYAQGTSTLTGGSHLALKESDRRSGVLRLAQALGSVVDSSAEGITIRGGHRAPRLQLLDLTDHRMFMSAVVGAAGLEQPSLLGPTSAPSKSYPGFLRDIETLGVTCHGEEVKS